ncbi:degenerin unc-8 [Aphelenchoides avenae]|nr:degenerin unc-8 [Aphelenchus avenae]
MPTVDDEQSTTRTSTDPEHHATTDSGVNWPEGHTNHAKSRTSSTTTSQDASANTPTQESNAEGDAPHAKYTTPDPTASGSELPTTTYEEYLKGIKLNLGLHFDLKDLTEEQKQNFNDLGKAYGLDPANSQVLVDAYMKLALQIIAAKMTPEQRQIVGFQLKDLVSSCIMNGEPCDMINDFKQTFDVDYGNCYTFNHASPAKYITKRAGSAYGLRMTVISNSSELLPSSSEEGIKIVVHGQHVAPFPNVEGYRSPSKVSKLGAPHGRCSTLESIARNKQPFYYNGSYTTEGCFRSCFQRNIATACGCYDHRFPPPTDMDVPVCDPLEPSKYKCADDYIEDNGDYFAVKDCRCYDPCEDTSYRSQIAESPWPAGSFFYGGHCPLAKKQGMDCSKYYRNNAMRLEVSYAQLGFGAIEEESAKSSTTLAKANTLGHLFNDLAGNSGLWIGYTMLSLVEIVLITIQICLWTCGKELPEVPSLFRLNPWAEAGEESDSDEWDDDDEDAPSSSGARSRRSRSLSMSRLPPKNFDNSIFETGKNLQKSV